MVVDDISQMIGGQVVSALVEYFVVEDGAVEGHTSTYHIVDLDFDVRSDEEADDILRTLCYKCLDLFLGEDEGVAHRSSGSSIVLEVGDRLALLLQLFGCVEGDISTPSIEELLYVLAVDISTFALAVGPTVSSVAYSFVEVNTKPLKCLYDVRLGTRHEALAVCVLYTEEEFTAMCLGKQVVI